MSHITEEDGVTFAQELRSAFEENGPGEFGHDDVASVLRCYVESPEGYGSVDMAGVLMLRDGRFGTVRAWADTTGWDCRSDAEFRAFATEDEAVRWGLDTGSRQHLGYDEPTIEP